MQYLYSKIFSGNWHHSEGVNSLRTTQQTGFTLIELVAVLTIVSILSIYVIPKFFTVNNFSQRTSYDQILTSIHYAQRLAVGMGCEVQVSITNNSLVLNLRSNCRSGEFTQSVQDPANRNNAYLKAIPKAIVLSANNFPIYFDRLGRAHNNVDVVADTTLNVGNKLINIIGETGFAYSN